MLQTAVGVVAKYGVDEIGNHLFEFGNKLLSTVGATLNLTEFVFPKTREFGTLEEFFLNQTNEGYACGSGFQTLALLTNVAALVERLDDGGSRGRTTDAVFFHRLTEFFVVDIATSGFHSAQERCFCEGLGRSGFLLRERGDVRACFAFGERGKGAFFFAAHNSNSGLPLGSGALPFGRNHSTSIALLRCCPTLFGIVFWKKHTPTLFDNDFAGSSEGNARSFAIDSGGGKAAIGIEHGDEALHNEVVDIALHIGETVGLNASGDDGVVIGDFGIVEHLFRFAQRG